MADFQKRAKQTRKQAAKRAKNTQKRARASVKTTRKAVAKTSKLTHAQAIAAAGMAIGAAAAVGKLLKGRGKGEQRYSSEPDNLPNTPTRPAATTPPVTETERARAEQTSS